MRKPESWFHDLGTKYVLAQAYFHLNQAGVFSLLGKKGPLPEGAIARSLKLDEKTLASLLDYAASVDDVLEDRGGRWGFSRFGRAVLKRYGSNFFDVRVGAYAPVWNSLGDMLTGRKTYGVNLKREGRFSEDGLYKSAAGVLPALEAAVKRARPAAVVEFGTDTGLIDRLSFPVRYGLDRKRKGGIRADLFEPSEWSRAVRPKENVFFFSLHFHEFLAQGFPAFRRLLRSMRKLFPGAHLAVIEQPRLPRSRRGRVAEYLWLYGQSNVLIHHLIGNGKILTEEEWVGLLRAEGLTLVSRRKTGHLGYILFLLKL